jgi:integrase/recombinase XerD
MSRFQERLDKKSLHDSTKQKYEAIIESAGNAELVDWLHRKVNRSSPLGTLLPMRAAVKHFLISEQGYTEDEVESLLPDAVGQDPALRDALDTHQLAIFYTAIESVSEPAKTILTLLPMTGLSISEACALTRDQVNLSTEQISLSKTRMIPLNRASVNAIKKFLSVCPIESGPLFRTSNYGTVITPHGVRKYTRSIAKQFSVLGHLTPMVLRHTYAKMTLADGASLERLRQLLGHVSINTTRRYLEF